MKKNLITCALLAVCGFILSGCAHDLGERPGYFMEPEEYTGIEETCEHIFAYEYSFFHSTSHPAGVYHYVRCCMFGKTDLCDFAPTFEKHEFVDMEDTENTSYNVQYVPMYNGRMYKVINQICSKCNRPFSGNKYVLVETCGDNE